MNEKSQVLSSEDFIQEGVSPAPGVLILACTVGDDFDDEPLNRILLHKDSQWLEFQTSNDSVVSVDARPDGRAYVLGDKGSVVQFDWLNSVTSADVEASQRVLIIDPVADLGPLRRIRILGDYVFCVGSVGQVYGLRNGGFETLPALHIAGQAVTIEDIAGTGIAEFGVATSDGYAAWFDGTAWQQADLPTNANLTSIAKVDVDRYAIVGWQSTLLIGQFDEWHVVEPIDPDRPYWGVGARDGFIYAAYKGGIDSWDGTSLTPLVIPDVAGRTFAKLRNSPEGLWSCSGQSVGVIIRNKWHSFL